MTAAELLELVHSAPRRFTSLRAVARTWMDFDLFGEAAGRQQQRPQPGGTSVQTFRLWLAGPRRLRIEWDDATWGSQIHVVNDDEWWWYRGPGRGVLGDVDGEPVHYANPLRTELELATRLRRLDHIVLGSADHARRACIHVVARPLGPQAVGRLPGAGLVVGEERHVLIDAERGVALRTESRLRNQPFWVFELIDVAYDEALAEDLFSSAPPPGESVRTYAEEVYNTFLPPEEAARRASFPLLMPADMHDGACPCVMYKPGVAGCSDSIDLIYSLPGSARLYLRQTADPIDSPESDGWAQTVAGGLELWVKEPDATDELRHVVFHGVGTNVLASSTFARDELVRILASLAPIS